MTLHYGGKYNGDEKSLPQREHHPNAVAFIEAASTKELSLMCNCGCILLMIILAVPFVLLGKEYFHSNRICMILAAICGVLSLFPHELLHAICYKEDVYLYNNLRQGLFFVIGTEAMSKSRFVFMSQHIFRANPVFRFSFHSSCGFSGAVRTDMYWNGLWRLHQYIQCNQANAQRGENIFERTTFILVFRVKTFGLSG